MKIIDLDEIYNFLVLSFFIWSRQDAQKINNIFELKGIFVFSHLQFDDVRDWTDGNGMEDPKKLK